MREVEGYSDIKATELDTAGTLGILNSLAQWIKWSKNKLFVNGKLVSQVLQTNVLALGNWLKAQDYIGSDVKVGYPPKGLSTTAGFSLIGWIDLYTSLNAHKFLDEAEKCLKIVLESQSPDGSWLFPYPFRNNQSEYPYACEILMTLRSLLYYLEHSGANQEVLESIRRGIKFLMEDIGFDGGILWYSPADKIVVPNVSSMAANVFARAYRFIPDEQYIILAKEFVDFCIEEQQPNGAYPYFGEGDMVSIPYHALETWELIEANEVIGDNRIAGSTDQAISYLEKNIEHRNYRTTNTDSSKLHLYLFKTPLWSAKAFLMNGNFHSAFNHYTSAIRIFQKPNTDHFFYILRRLGIGKFALEFPVFDSVFIRYNASAFELGARLLSHLNQEE